MADKCCNNKKNKSDWGKCCWNDSKLHKELNELTEQLEKSKNEIESLDKELIKFQEISKNSHSQYINLKYDFDSLQIRVEKERKEMKRKVFVETISHFLPLMEQLRQMVEAIPSDLESNSWVEWVRMVYKNIWNSLESMWVKPIQSIWMEVDLELHEPIWVEEWWKDNKWKIVKELERWFIYMENDEKIIIRSAKVIVAN